MDPFNAVGSADAVAGGAVMAPYIEGEVMRAPRARFEFECRDAAGNLKWTDSFENVVTTVGKVDILEKYFRGSAYTAAWYLVLAGTGTKAVGDTLASHAGWSEVTPYAGSNRPTVTFTAAAANSTNGQVVSNQVSVSINAASTVAGAGLCVTQSNASTAGVLYNVGNFTDPRSVSGGDTLNVTITLTIT